MDESAIPRRPHPPITRHVKRLCTVEEFRLYRESLDGRLEKIAFRDLLARRRRARTLRDKYRDVHRRQRGGARGKRSDGRAREVYDFSLTRRKAEIFARALERFEGRLHALAAEQRRREDETRRTNAGLRHEADREGRRIHAEQVERESHLDWSLNVKGPRSTFGARTLRPGNAIQRVSERAAAGHFRSANRRFQARRDRGSRGT